MSDEFGGLDLDEFGGVEVEETPTQEPQFPILPPTAGLEEALRQPSPVQPPWQGGVVRSVLPGVLQPEDLKPAIRLVGEIGDTHADILERHGIEPELIPHESPNRGFEGPGMEFVPRIPAADALGIEGTAKAGGLDSMDLSALQEPEGYKKQLEKASETELEGPLPTLEEMTQIASVPMQAIGQVAAGLVRTGRQLMSPTTWLPPEMKPKPPFVVPLGEGEIRYRTPEEMAAAEPIQAGKPLYEPEPGSPTAESNELARFLSRWSTPESLAVLPAGTTRLGASLLLSTMAPGLIGQIKDTIQGTGTDQEKRDRINDLVALAALISTGEGQKAKARSAEDFAALTGRIKAEPSKPSAVIEGKSPSEIAQEQRMDLARRIPEMTPAEFMKEAPAFNTINLPLGEQATAAQLAELRTLLEKAQVRSDKLIQDYTEAKAVANDPKATESERSEAKTKAEALIPELGTTTMMPQFFNEAIKRAETIGALEAREGFVGKPLETEAIWKRLEDQHGIKKGGVVEVINDPNDVAGGRILRDKDGNPTGIQLNQAQIATHGSVDWVLQHEAAHWFDLTNPDVIRQIQETIPEAERTSLRNEVATLGYTEEKIPYEITARSVQALADSWKGRGWFDKLVGNIQRFASETIGIKLTRRAAESTAVRAIAQSIKRIGEARPKAPDVSAAMEAWRQRTGVPVTATSLEGRLPDLTKQIADRPISPEQPFSERLKSALNIAGRWSRGMDTGSRAIANVRAASSALWNAYKNLPPWRDFETSVGRWIGADQQTSLQVRDFQKRIAKAVPNKLRQEAITNWIQADGDQGLLQQRAAASKPAVRRGYELAQQLNPEEIQLARNISQYLDERLQEGQQAGLLQQGVDNYVTQIWKKPTTATNKLWSDLFGTGTLNPSFKFARKRIFESYFEGEQAGYTPRNKSIGTLIAVYDSAFNRALSARGLIKELHNGVAADGKPIVMTTGSGTPVPKGQEARESYLIKPHVRPEGAVTVDGRPYRRLDHWALRGWMWATKTESGEPIFVQGDMLVHPDHYNSLKNALTKSALRQFPVSRWLLSAGALAKQTKLSLSPFHTVQEGLHAMAHRVDPTGIVKSLAEIDLTQPEQKALVDHGLMVSDPHAAELFGEGLTGGGLVGKIPGLGRLQQWYTDMTFREYIPKLKMTMALDALQRNRAAYAKDIRTGKVTDDQILALTARQSNAAFGEQNYRMMGRNPSVQDFLRLALLAPDFLEARFRFVGQALRPYGREQRIALGLMAATLYTTCRMMNKMLDDEYHWDKPFSVFYKGREYHLRTLLGDVQHLITNPRTFWYNRLAPITRTISEYVTGRDDRGIKRSSVEQLGDFLKWFQPIPFQRRPGERLREQLLTAAAVPSVMASKQQELYQILDRWRSRQTDPKIKEAYDRERQETHIQSPYTELRASLKMGDIAKAHTLYQSLLQSKTPEVIDRAMRPWSGGTFNPKTMTTTPRKVKPFSGSHKAEKAFLKTLTPSQLNVYNRARQEREQLYQTFLQMLKIPGPKAADEFGGIPLE